MTQKNRTVPFFLFSIQKILFSWYFYHPQVEQLPEEQEEQELELVGEELPPQQTPKPLKILLISLLLHLVQAILPSSISLIVALTSKVLWQS
jgi:hypothetical protein